jgi:hypothetical protein
LARASFQRPSSTIWEEWVEGSRIDWSPDELIEFLHRLNPTFMTSPRSYTLLGFVRHGPPKEDIEKALIKRLPQVDWKTVDAKLARDIRDELAGSIGWNFGVSESTRPFFTRVLVDIAVAHPERQEDDLLE